MIGPLKVMTYDIGGNSAKASSESVVVVNGGVPLEQKVVDTYTKIHTILVNSHTSSSLSSMMIKS